MSEFATIWLIAATVLLAGLHQATKGKFHRKRLAMGFFGWYVADYPGPDIRSFTVEGAVAESIPVMRAWARKEPELEEAAKAEIWGTGRRLVEGRALDSVGVDEGQDAVEIAKNVRRRDAQRQDTVLPQKSIAPRVAAWLLAPIMRLAIDLDAKLHFVAIEIEILNARRMLLAPLETRLPFSKLPPKQNLRKAHLATQFLRAAIRLAGAFQHLTVPVSRFARPSSMLRMVPLPQQAGGGLKVSPC